MGFYKRLFCSSFNSPVLTGAPASQQRGRCKVPALFWWQTWVQGMARLELGSPPTTPGWGRGDRLQGPADLSNWAPGPAIAGKSQYSAGQEKTTNTCGKDGPAGRGLSFLGFQGQREAFGYDQDYSPLAGQARLCLVLAGLLQRGQAALRRDSAQLRCPLTPGGSQGAGTQLHPGSSLLKNLEENGAAVNTLHQCRCNIPRSQLLLLQHQARWTKVGVACGFCAAGTNDRLEKAYGAPSLEILLPARREFRVLTFCCYPGGKQSGLEGDQPQRSWLRCPSLPSLLSFLHISVLIWNMQRALAPVLQQNTDSPKRGRSCVREETGRLVQGTLQQMTDLAREGRLLRVGKLR